MFLGNVVVFILFLAFIFVWIGHASVSICFYLGLIQLKYYRLDTLIVFLSEDLGRRLLWFFSLDLFLLMVLSALIFSHALSLVSLGFLVFLTGYYLWRLVSIRQRRFFNVTVKLTRTFRFAVSLLLILFSFALLLIFAVTQLYLALSVPFFAMLIFVSALLPFVVFVCVFALGPVFYLIKRRDINSARRLFKGLSVQAIGITGSYGKTSTKQFLTTLLSQKYKVVMTQENINETYVIAKQILSTDWHNKDFFVVEMGAYKRGEVRSSCELVSPSMGIITAVGNQHLALFGSEQNLILAKSELFDALPQKTGVAILNKKTNHFETVTGHAADCRLITVGEAPGADFWADGIRVTRDGTHFNLHYGTQRYSVFLPFLGRHFVANLLLAIAAAFTLGVSMEAILAGISQLMPPKTALQKRLGQNGVIILDDHYSVNVSGFLAGIEALKLFSDRQKIIVTPGLIELGAKTREQHERLIKEALKVADAILITRAIGLDKALLNDKRVVMLPHAGQALNWLKQKVTSQTVLLYEGKSFEILMTTFLKKVQ